MNIVILTGAGISAESGLGTFRSSGGLWEKFKIEDVATPMAWKKNPQLVLNFYNERRKQCKLAKPNKAHLALAELANYHNVSIITQNIDDLHERAGSRNITHLHGEILKAKTSELTREYYHIEKDIKLGDFNNGKDFYSYPENEKIKLSYNSYDLIISTGALSVYGNLNKAIPFVYGLLKDNGIFINSGVKDNLIGQVIGKVWHFKPKGLEEVIDVSRASQFSDVEKIHIPLSLFLANLTEYMITAKK